MDKEANVLDSIKIRLQYLLPKQGLTRLAGWAADKPAGWLTQSAIKGFARYYGINMQEALYPDPAHYKTFNDFFVRPLRDGVRPLAEFDDGVVLPADGAISQLGPIDEDRILQAKGHDYTLEALLAGQYPLAETFRGGQFVTTYLSPRDYHRVHMPCDGQLREMIYVPGDLFSVNPLTAANVPNLFARNERLICIFDTAFGPLAQILVGATIVGSIETVWDGCVNSERAGIIRRWTYPAEGERAVALKKGQEMGRFKLGSTVINLFAPGRIQFDCALSAGCITRMGRELGHAPAAAQESAANAEPT
ncbi:phosphatidylserine decarboxylase [Edwardsiella ictaluri]|uniref:archaetidylserine decarboxylase n=1 Tax=Edwardsiella ictaluri TaxID=67780 RepID=UPI0001A59D1A|nr:archaetidylserine decarboxylase [Edwardsiella ictaluri]AVZ81889.1 phosphatidylserine decarboxylase [Edwardsiella ictaluri]KMQ77309.1 phosphatidylserine decarboxylase [Edwardsiella ictaluri]UCQ48122.1 archaetidylserine decarboxylase [Edwardsiella ictaluri]UYB62061.1 archaetidylserine decarboxylase [Edwardsiella ictaluri]WJH20008.1 phosphatidylserine decarboxylase [Edwardsiella ictaluri]